MDGVVFDREQRVADNRQLIIDTAHTGLPPPPLPLNPSKILKDGGEGGVGG